jgi:hypothetical protein
MTSKFFAAGARDDGPKRSGKRGWLLVGKYLLGALEVTVADKSGTAVHGRGGDRVDPIVHIRTITTPTAIIAPWRSKKTTGSRCAPRTTGSA